MNKKNLQFVIKTLDTLYPLPKPSLDFSNNYELLVATMLSAQCTDKRVNIVTKDLFKKANTPVKMIDLGEAKLRTAIKSCGLYRNKAKNIIASSKALHADHQDQVPYTLKELTALPGVGRKTANVVLNQGFDIPTFPVDTHVFRVSERIGLTTNSKNPDDTERQLTKLLPKKLWGKLHLQIIFHGREICKAQKPLCKQCPLNKVCRYYKNLGR